MDRETSRIRIWESSRSRSRKRVFTVALEGSLFGEAGEVYAGEVRQQKKPNRDAGGVYSPVLDLDGWTCEDMDVDGDSEDWCGIFDGYLKEIDNERNKL